ncbi:MAG: T9SS type A sorting domain-containing protein [Bacteroidales bacterium]|nr:T9SS type A sorting domain-containing protein [Bacteroidales bacterium]
MKRFILSVLIMLFFGLTNMQAQKQVSTSIEETSKGIKISQQFDFLKLETISENGQSFYKIDMGEELLSSNKVGQADLPTYNCLIEIPFCSDIKIEQNILSKETINLKEGLKIYPKQPSQSKQNEEVPFELNTDYYSRNSFGSTELAQIEVLGVMNGVRLARLSICPVRYNPATAQIEYIKDLNIELTYINPDYDKTVKTRNKLTNSFKQFLGKKVINFNKSTAASTFNSPVNRPLKMIILSTPEFSEELQTFIEWKTQQGFDIVELTTDQTGTTESSIKTYLKNLWENSSETPADYLLICGDTGQIPACAGVHMYYSNDSQPTDLYYAEYTGDILPDIFYGRFSATTTTQLRQIIEKTIKYEKYAFDDAEYLNNILLVGGKETSGSAPTCVNGHLNYVKEYFIGLDTSIYYNPSSANYTSEIITKINDGQSWINYSAHCDETGWSNPSYDKSDVTSMRNVGKYSFFINNCCLSSRYNQSECFAEKLLRAEDKGAIGVIGGSNYTYWSEDFYWAVGAKNPTLNPSYNSNKLGAYDRFFHTHGESFGDMYISAGELMIAGNLAVETSGSSLSEYYWEIYTLLGDPSLIPYAGVGQEFNAELPELLNIGDNNLVLSNLPAYTYVGLSMGGNLLGAAQADGNGDVSISFDPINEPTYLNIVLTNQFYKTHIDSVLVSQSDEPFITLKDLSFVDVETMQEVSKLTPSKEYYLNFTVKNVGNQPLSSLAITLNDAVNATIVANTQSLGNIASNEEKQSTNVFKIKVDNALIDGTEVSFVANITGNNYSKTKDITKRVAAPKLTIESIKLSDVTDGKLLRVSLGNRGSVDVAEGTLQLLDMPDYVTVSSNIVEVPSLATQSEAEVSFTLMIDDSTFAQQDSLYFTLDYASGYYLASKSYVISLINELETFESGDFSSYAWEMDASAPWIIDSTTANNGTFSARSAAIDHNGLTTLTMVVNTAFRDSVSFYYKVSSESNYDFFRFYINGVSKISASGTNNADWQYKKFTLNAGEYILKWEYSKDYSTSSGEDCVRIDDVQLPRKANCVGLSELSSLDNISMYPNPAKDFVVLSNLNGDNQITITDLNGRMRYYQTTSSNSVEIDLSSLESGVYNLNIIKDNTILSKKLIIAE